MGVRRRIRRLVRTTFRRLGYDIVRYLPRPQWLAEEDRFEYQKQFIKFDIASGCVVLDVGSGHYPFPFATILADLWLGDTPHRARRLIRDNRPFLVMDVTYLPFRDKSIDFVYCSHVVEHLDNPMQACSELMRVGHRGYIEAPNYAKDILFAWANYTKHKWHVAAINNTLFFFEYSERERKGINSSAWDDLIHGDAYHPIQEAYFNNQDLFNVMFLWEDRFECVVRPLEKKTCRNPSRRCHERRSSTEP